MNKIVFYGISIRTLSMAEELQSMFPQCRIIFPAASPYGDLTVPPQFGTAVSGNPENFFEDVDFVVIDQSFAQGEETLSYLRKYLPEQAYVIELQSVKSDFYRLMCALLDGVCTPSGAYVFTDLTPGVIRGDLFRDKITALICDNQPKTLERLKYFWSLFGAKVIPTSPEFFDEITASTMSAGTLLSSMYVHILQSDSWADTLFFGFYNRALRQATGGISQNSAADADALMRNRENISHVLSFFKREIHNLERLFAEENKEKLALYLEQAQKFQDRI